MIINVTYDASAANAPAGFDQAVQAAVQFWESQISTPITVNLTFGYGSVDGQPLDAGALGENIESGIFVPYASVLKGLATQATSPADFASLSALLTGDPTDGSTFFATTAQAKALGLYPATESGTDGYVGLSDTAAFNYTPNSQAVAGDYDPVGALEHEISEVLGRISGLGQTTDGGAPLYTAMDLFRYSSAGVRDLTPASGYFSVDGKSLLLQFNNPGNGGDAGDLTNADSDAFSAFATPGFVTTISNADLELMDVLGYTLGTGALPAAPGVAVPTVAAGASTTVYTATTTIAAGQTLYFVMQPPPPGSLADTTFYSVTLGPLQATTQTSAMTLTNEGTVVTIGAFGSVVGIDARNDGDTFTNGTTGVIEAEASGGASANAVNIESNSAFNNSGVITSESLGGSADGVFGNFGNYATSAIFNNAAGGVISVWAKGNAIAVYWLIQTAINAGTINATSLGLQGEGATGVFSPLVFTNTATGVINVVSAATAAGVASDGNYYHQSPVNFTNAGVISVTGSQATGICGGDIVNNSGTIIARDLVPGSGSIGIEILRSDNYPETYSYTNSGTISADIAIYDLTITDKVITNSGDIFGDLYFDYSITGRNVTIDNTGTIVGDIIFNSGTDTFNGAGGKLLGNIYLGSGVNKVALGNDGETVFGGGLADTIIGGAGDDVIAISAGNNVVDGGGGDNIVSFAGAASAVNLDLGAGTATVNGSDTITNIQTVIGSQFNDTLKAGSGAAELIAGSGAAILIGGAGNDTLVAGTGGDTITGGGGNNDFVYSAGDNQLVITDFSAAGSHNLLSIYGYTSAQSVTQQGADTLITLSNTDSILLKGVQASSLNGKTLVYSSGSFDLPFVPFARPSTVLDLSADYTVSSGNILKLSELPIGIIEDVDAASKPITFSNQGEVDISNDAAVEGIAISSSASVSPFASSAGSVFDVTSSDDTATGYDAVIDPLLATNAGKFGVTALNDAEGFYAGGAGFTFNNAATGTISVTSRAGDATGVYTFNTDTHLNVAGTLVNSAFDNQGTIAVTGVTSATAINLNNVSPYTSFTNVGAIAAVATGSGAKSVAIDFTGLYAPTPADGTALLAVINSGTITAQCAIQDSGPHLDVVNSGTINGTIALGGEIEQIDNTGTINGDITSGSGLLRYYGADGILHGSIDLSTDTGGNWDTVAGSGNSIDLAGAQAAITGGGEIIGFTSGTGNVVGLYGTGGHWDTISGPVAGTVYLTSAQAAIAGGGDVVSFAGGTGNVVGLYDTGGTWDSVWAPGGETIYLTSAQAAVAGGGDTISFAGGSGNVVGLYDTGGAWDSVWAPGGETIYLTSAQAAITGGGNAISFAGGTGNVVGLYDTGGTADTIWAPGGATIYFTSAQATVTGGGDAISFAGGIGNAATLQNTGATADTVYATGGTISLNNAQAAFTGTGDIVNFSGSSAATFAGANQTLAFAPRIGGNDVITGFASSDSVQFSASDFNSWAALLGATTQSGSDTLITLNASNTVRLVGVTASSLTASQFHFV
ncbi:NF038122 family metalloprotease [Novosphingobium sp.]|uniref:NF038122 family metalloprotease n=1 Tax=Novosphingobium sp. TaxID=1874826 RepID=UPI003B51FA9E